MSKTQLNLFDNLSEKFQKKLKKITYKTSKKDNLSLKGWLLSYSNMDEEPLTNKNVYTKVIGFVNEFFSDYELPGRTEIKFDRLRNASYVDNTFEALDSADVALNVEFLTLSGIKVRAEMTVPVKNGEFVEPSVLFINGNSRIISQTTLDDITKKGTFTRQLFKNPEDIVTPEMLKSYQDIELPVVSMGMYSASKDIMNKVADYQLDKSVDKRIQAIRFGTPELNTVNTYVINYESKIAETNQNWNYDDLYDYVVAGIKKEGMSIDSFEVNRLISKALFRSNQDTHKEVIKTEKKQEKEYLVTVLIDDDIELETNVWADSETEAMDKADELIRERDMRDFVVKYEDSTIDVIRVIEASKKQAEEQKDYTFVSPEETEEIPLMYYFYEYPEHKILDENNNYIAGYQLVIWEDNNYIVTLQPDVIADKIASGEINLYWEQDAHNADIQSPTVWKDYGKKISNKKEAEIDENDISITPTREGFLFEYRTPEDIVIKQHYIGYEDKEEMMAMFLDYIQEEEQKYGLEDIKESKVSMTELLAGNDLKEGDEVKVVYSPDNIAYGKLIKIMDTPEGTTGQVDFVEASDVVDIEKIFKANKESKIAGKFSLEVLSTDTNKSDAVFSELQKVVEEMKRKNPKGWLESWESRQDTIALEIAEKLNLYFDARNNTLYFWDKMLGENYIEEYIKQEPTNKTSQTDSKKFNVQYNVGKAKYVVNFHDGVSKHKDGSDFYGIRIFKNIKDFEQFQQKLLSEGYKEAKVSMKANKEASQIQFYKWKKATGEPDQDYAHAFFDAIVKQLEEAGIAGATHKEFDKYQGVYLRVPDVDTFWIKDIFYRGDKAEEDIKKPYTKATLIDIEGNTGSASKGDYFTMPDNYILEGYTLELTKQDGTVETIENPTVGQLPDITEVMSTFTYKPGTTTEVYVFTPEHDPDVELEVTNKEGIVDARELIEYCKPFFEEGSSDILVSSKKRGMEDETLKEVAKKLLDEGYIYQDQYEEAIKEIDEGTSPDIFEVVDDGTVYVHGAGAYPWVLKNYIKQSKKADEEQPEDIIFKQVLPVEEYYDLDDLIGAINLAIEAIKANPENYALEVGIAVYLLDTISPETTGKYQPSEILDFFRITTPEDAEFVWEVIDDVAEKVSDDLTKKLSGKIPDNVNLFFGHHDISGDYGLLMVYENAIKEEFDKTVAEKTGTGFKNEEEYRVALTEAEKLISLDPEPETKEGKRLNFLANLIEDYEKKTFDLSGEKKESGYISEDRTEGRPPTKDNLAGGSSEELMDAIVGDKEENWGSEIDWEVPGEEGGIPWGSGEYMIDTNLDPFNDSMAILIFDNMMSLEWGESYGEQYAFEDAMDNTGISKEEAEQIYDAPKVFQTVYDELAKTKRGQYVINEYKNDFELVGILEDGKKEGRKQAQESPIPEFVESYIEENPTYEIMDYGDDWILAVESGTLKAVFAYGFDTEGYMEMHNLADVGKDYQDIFKNAIEENNLEIEEYSMQEEDNIISYDTLVEKELNTSKKAIEFVPSQYTNLNLVKEQNPFNKNLKYKVTYKLKAYKPEDNDKIVPLEEQNENEKWFKTLKEAEEFIDFHTTHYLNDWGQGSWRRIEWNKQALWKDKLQNVYESLEEFKQYDEMYGLIERLGFDNAEEAWEANPMIQGTVYPEDYKVVGENNE